MKNILTVILLMLSCTLCQAASLVNTTTGSTVTMYLLNCEGTKPFTYQWMRNDVDIPGATSENLVLGPTTTSDTAIYRVRVSNSAGSVVSDTYNLIVSASSVPVIPSSLYLRIFSNGAVVKNLYTSTGNSIKLAVTASGTSSFTFKWYKNGTVIVGATGAIYMINSFLPSDAGNYTVVVSNAAGSTTSPVVVITDSTSTIVPPSDAIIDTY